MTISRLFLSFRFCWICCSMSCWLLRFEISTVAAASSSSDWNHLYHRRRFHQKNLQRPCFFLPDGGIRGGGQQQDDDDSTTATSIIEENETNDDGFTIMQQEIIHDGWRQVINRRVQLPVSKLQVDFELVGQKGGDNEAVLVFAWDTQSRTATLIREYMPSTHKKMMGLAAGMVEYKHQQHHHDANNNNNNSSDKEDTDVRLIAAQHELEEECRMTGGTWLLLTEKPIVMDKYSMTGLSVYLVLDAVPVPAEDLDAAKPRDATEEGMEVVAGVTVSQIERMITNGAMTVVGGWGSLIALRKLRAMGEIQEEE